MGDTLVCRHLVWHGTGFCVPCVPVPSLVVDWRCVMPLHRCHICKGPRCPCAHLPVPRCPHFRSSFLGLCSIVVTLTLSSTKCRWHQPLVIGQWRGTKATANNLRTCRRQVSDVWRRTFGNLTSDMPEPSMVNFCVAQMNVEPAAPDFNFQLRRARAEPERRDHKSRSARPDPEMQSQPSDSTSKSFRLTAKPIDLSSQ